MLVVSVTEVVLSLLVEVSVTEVVVAMVEAVVPVVVFVGYSSKHPHR